MTANPNVEPVDGLVDRAARIIMQTVHSNGSVTSFWPTEEALKITARAALTQSSEREAKMAAEIERLRESLFNAAAMIGHNMPMDASALVAGKRLSARDVWDEARQALGGPYNG